MLTDSLSIALALMTVWLLAVSFNGFALLVGLFMAYRIVNLERLTHRRLQDDYVQHLAKRASLVLMGLQALALSALLLAHTHSLTGADYLVGLAMVDLVIAGVLAHIVDDQGRKTVAQASTTQRAEQELPTLTVAIPARNETADLEACLQTLTHSTYLKLEILVLDDCSQTTRTPEIIRQFAHDGVRFIAGSVAPISWLAKNHAYQQLIAEANGEVILFCGVDARFEPDALRQIVETMLTKRKTMLSIMPRNLVPGRLKLEALMVQPGRYAWELVLPRRWTNRPPVLSSCWLVQKQLLEDAGGMAAVHRTVSPERYFARYAAMHHDGYSFLQSGDSLGVASAKQFGDQRATAIRVRYPGLHRRIELTAIVSLAELGVLVGPFAGLLLCLVSGQSFTAILFSVACLLQIYMYFQVVRITYQQRLLRALWLLPFAALYDIGLLNYSMWMYEFREVIWKGRNLCIPVMRVIPSLPWEARPSQTDTGYPRHHHHRHHRHRHHRR